MSSSYTFGDSELASERMAVVADAFAPTSRALLESIAAPVARVLDLGPGPGYSTALLASRFPMAEIVAVEQSDAFAAQARERVPTAAVILGDVTEPLLGAGGDGFDVVYARFLLSHLPDLDATLATWCAAVSPGGRLVLEEPERITARDPLFARYEAIVAAVVGTTGADMYIGATLARTVAPPGFTVDHSAAVDPGITAGAAAAMFWRNARAWDARAAAIATPGEIDELVTKLKERVGDPTRDAIEWRVRQVVFRRTERPA